MAWYSGSWNSRLPLTIQASKVDADLTDFPVYVNLNNLPADFHNKVKTDGSDIRVTKEDGTTELPIEVVGYDSATDTGSLHFKYTGTLSGTSDTIVYIYYYNPGASAYAPSDTYGSENVFNSNYTTVLHLNSDPSGSAPQELDTTSGNHDATSAGSMTSGQLVAGKMWKALDFDGDASSSTSDYIQADNSLDTISSDLSFTVSLWANFDNFGSSGVVLYANTGATDNKIYTYVGTTGFVRFLYNEVYVDTSAGVLTTGGWHLLHLVHINNTEMDVYVDGSRVLDGTSSSHSAPTFSSQDLRIGNYVDGQIGNFAFNGKMEELRLNNSSLSSTWISTEYNNQNSPSTFYNVGSVESNGSPSPSRSPSISISSSPSASMSHSPSQSPSASPSAGQSPSSSPSTSASSSPSISQSPSASPSASPSISASASPSPTRSPSISPSSSTSSSPSFGSPNFTSGNQCYFMQIGGYLYIANGVDPLVRYNGTTIETYTEISAPANLAASYSSSTISAGSYTIYAEVTAVNSIGETVGSSEASKTVNKDRDSWIAGVDKLMWDWDAVVGADAYQLYIGTQSGRTYLLAQTSDTFFEDDGSKVLNTYVEPPLSNTTGAPKFKSMAVSGNRMWATNDPNNQFMVYWSGTGTDMGKFSDFYGGGWINLEKGGRERPTSVVHYQSGTGDSKATVLSRTPEGRGAIWQIGIDTLTVGDTSFSVPNAIKVTGSFGTDSILGVVPTTNDILYPNRRGIYSLGPEKNFYGILRTKELSSKIRPYWNNLIGSALTSISGYFYDSKVFWSVPTAGTSNNRTIVYDLERMNWTVEWTIGAKQFFEYTDTSGNNHFMYIANNSNRIIEISENISGDMGAAFSTYYSSGRIPLAKLWKDFVKVNKVFVKLGNPRGNISFTVSGTQKNSPFSSIGEANIGATTSNSGMGWDLMGNVLLGDTNGTVETFSDSSSPHFLKIRKKLRDIKLSISSNSNNTDYVLQGFIIEGSLIKVNPPTAWKLS